MSIKLQIKPIRIYRIMFPRFIEPALLKSHMPVILLNGARQVGKSTLVKKIFGGTHEYITLDDPQVLSLIARDPMNFIR